MRLDQLQKLLFAIAYLLMASLSASKACTIAAVSGKATIDGRPLLLKNRDSLNKDIRIKIAKGCKYTYLCQCIVPNGSALSGFNEAGFAIVNSHSYNLPNTDYDWNAHIMQLALESCGSITDFEQLLIQLPKPISVTANYGVMDAKGNVAIFETSAYTYTWYNVDDTPNGYLVRSNFSLSGDMFMINAKTPTSWPRYNTAIAYLEQMSQGLSLSKEHLFDLTRYLIADGGINLYEQMPDDENDETIVDFQNFIPRFKSTSAMVIQGIKNGESPKNTIAWTMVGPPISTVTIPFWITPSKALPSCVVPSADGHALLCRKGQLLKDSVFTDEKTVNLAWVYNQSGTGIIQKTVQIESEILQKGDELTERIRQNSSAMEDISAFYSWVDSYVENQYFIAYNEGENAAISDGIRLLPGMDNAINDLLGRSNDNGDFRFGIRIKNGKKYIVK